MNDKTKPHVDVRDKVFYATLRQLDALGCTYHIFCPWTGDEHGYPLAPAAAPAPAIVPEVTKRVPADAQPEPVKKRRTHDLVRGEARNRHMLPFLMQLKLGGDPVDIPKGDFTLDELQSAAGSRLARAFGENGCYVTSRNHATGTLQAMVLKNEANPKLGEAEAIVKTFGDGPLAAYAEECLEGVKRSRLSERVTELAQKHKSA